MEEIRLQKYIANSGVCSRRHAEELIKEGKVTVNGVKVTELGTKVTVKDVVLVNSERIKIEEEKIYIMLNKPKGYVTTLKDEYGRKNVIDLIHEKERIYPVGRLDKDTTGLLLLTNDGDFANKVMHPSKEIYKTYIATLDKSISKKDIETLKKGVDIGDFVTSKARAKILDSDATKVEIKIHEGKNRQVRRMFLALGYTVINLHRNKIGNLELRNVKEGKYVKLDKKEAERVFNLGGNSERRN